MIGRIVIWLLSSALSAVLYRAGGMDKGDEANPKWIPKWLRESWVRDWLCPACASLVFLSFCWPSSRLSWGLLLLSYILCGLALSAYWSKWFGFDNFWFHGFMIGLAAFLLFWMGVHWYAILDRALILAVLVGGWSAWIKLDWLEEGGRGFFIAATIPLLFI